MDNRDTPLTASAGLLRDMQIPELLWQLHESGRTGCLKVQHGEVIK